MFDAPDGLKGYVGEEDGFDPLSLSTAFDMVRRTRPPASRVLGCACTRIVLVGVAGCIVSESHRSPPCTGLHSPVLLQHPSEGAVGCLTRLRSRRVARPCLPLVQIFPSLSWNPSQKWLREAEVKHGRICMLAFVGFVAGDLLPLPGVTLSSVAAHDANLGDYGGAMGQIFWWIGLVEILGSIPAINYTMNGGDREPGDYAFDPLGFLASATPAQKEEMQLKELKNGRLAMMAFSGIVTQAALGHPNFPYV